MSISSSLSTLAQWLAGEFDNQAQSWDQPAWFVHLRWWHRPLPQRIDGGIAIFAEQANIVYLNNPYRQRVLVLDEPSPNQLRGRYWAFKHPEAVRGAGANPDLLQSISLDDLEQLNGNDLNIRRVDDRFMAEPPDGQRCSFYYDGQMRQVALGFTVSDRHYWSYDRGIDPETGKALWGAIMGPYEFKKLTDFSADLALSD